MQFKSVSTSGKDFVKPRQWKEWKQGDYVIGTKVECKEVDKYKKPIFSLVVKESNFGAEVNKPIYLNCGGNFRNMIEMVEDGEICRVQYKGMTPIKKGDYKGTNTHVMEVGILDAEPSDDVL